MALFRRTIRAKGPDRFLVDLPDELREVLAEVCTEIDELLDGDDATDHPALRRVFPPASPDDPAVQDTYRELVGTELLRSRRAALSRISATARDTELDRATMETWMTGLNTIRLVLGTRLEVDGETLPELAPDDPDLPAWALYEFLGALVGWIVDALARTAD